MGTIKPEQGLSTLVNHVAEGHNPHHAHVTPIYQTSTFSFPDVATGASIFKGEEEGYVYTRLANPNQAQLAAKYAVLEGLDLLRSQPDRPVEDVVDAHLFATGMAAVTAAILARVKSGQTIIAQEALYSATYNFLHDLAPRYGIQVVWLSDPTRQAWEQAFAAHPDAVLAYAESPANPTMAIVDLAAVAEICHQHNAWLMVDNTFATPYCQRPLTLGVDVVVHSTTKYLSGHGLVVGGTVISRHVNWVRGELYSFLKILGGSASPFDAWLANIGLKTFELRMQRHCENAMQVARYLETHPAIAQVWYPGLESHPGYAIAKQQMHAFGGMIAFELQGGLEAGAAMMNRVQLATLAVSLGNVDTLIQHPASMTHAAMPREARLQAGITDGLVRLSVGVENVADIIADLEQALQ
ncbi:MAG TPA: aminotransferase class I/II-fold pyridoxal phosphate-dependent enzyme [Anaerolineaceae bacterium]|nr:aminotransferase class I/II-fold pyridoxal phosphate-dependent enzyme [Anaerolineaceae bacterium]HOH21352.1 aminotransferase class I/II-fold pyridoxal phosphate-dependent enzyme [Anaerolineaceae bacterium]HPA33965.1 aminotransferase class I/II-fold pyridoxal phosphate-dependent enzyme [Anaerolineaceae bacterium]HQO98737.1 aminotransferase class I/II-fold pyridoxal phosphate-dependent enzyme [Anaerolineaceae bacterium]HQP62131.1 aminotransferase class I/II-fold pyridoxal phosphate-dependent e